MMKSKPAFPFSSEDWLRNNGVQSCSFATRGIWIEILIRMWDADEPGKLEKTQDEFCRLIGCKEEEFLSAIDELERNDVMEVLRDSNAKNNAKVTLINHSMYDEHKARRNAALRQKRYKEIHAGNAKNNAKVTPVLQKSNAKSNWKGDADVTQMLRKESLQVSDKHDTSTVLAPDKHRSSTVVAPNEPQASLGLTSKGFLVASEEKEENEEEQEEKERSKEKEEKEEVKEEKERAFFRELNTSKNKEEEKRKEKQKEKKKEEETELSEDFEEWWESYPNKQGKERARKHYFFRRKRGETKEELERALKRYLAVKRKQNSQMFANGSTFLNPMPRGDSANISDFLSATLETMTDSERAELWRQQDEHRRFLESMSPEEKRRYYEAKGKHFKRFDGGDRLCEGGGKERGAGGEELLQSPL